VPRYNKEREFQLGEYWLSKQTRSDAWCRTWFDQKTRQTKRVSLRTADIAEAKQTLTDWFVLQHSKPKEEAQEKSLAEIFARFYEQHGKNLKSASDVNRTLNYWLEFHTVATVAEAANQQKQLEFREWLQTERKLSQSSVRRALLVGKSALNWAWKQGELANVPYIPLVAQPPAAPKGRPLEIGEVATLIRNAKSHHLRVLISVMLGTACRTGAALDLNYSQIDCERGLIFLNPEGRLQTKKFRPTVKLPLQLRTYFVDRKRQHPIGAVVSHRDAPVNSIKTSWRTLVKNSDLQGNVQTYSFRHTMARWLRMSSVPAWEVAAQLGHKSKEFSTTEIYAPFDPAYLSQAVTAIDGFLGQVACELRVKSISEYLENDP